MKIKSSIEDRLSDKKENMEKSGNKNKTDRLAGKKKQKRDRKKKT